MKSVLCLVVVAALFVGCGDDDGDPPSISDLEDTREEMADILADEEITVDDFRERAAWLSDMPEDERAEQIRSDFEFGLSMSGVSSPVVEDWSNDQIIEYARKVCEAMEGAGDMDQYIMSLTVIVAGYDLNAYEDQVAAVGLAGAASNGWCFDEAERLGMIDAALGGSDLEEGRAEDHQQELATGESTVIASHVVAVDGYTYLNATDSETRGAINRLGLIEEQVGDDLFSAVALHGVVADDPSQNTAGRSDGGWEVGYLNLVQFTYAVPYGLDEELATSLYGDSPIDSLDIDRIQVFVFENPNSRYSRYTYVWFEHGLQGAFDGADREPLELWLAAYFEIPKLNQHETEKLHARLADVAGFRYIDVDTGAPAGLGEMLGPLESVAHSVHKVANMDGSLGALILAETDETDLLLQVFADFEVVDEVEVSGHPVMSLEGSSDGLDGYGFVFSVSGISGSLATNASDLAAAERFLEAFLAS
jgi:hypothetical protein